MDDPLRLAERAVHADPNDMDAAVALLNARVRNGELSRKRVEEAARLGHAAAQTYTGLAERGKHHLQTGIALLGEREWRLLGADFAEHVLHRFETLFPDDRRPRKVIEAERLFAYGLIDQGQLTSAAAGAAWAAWATWGAARAAARAAEAAADAAEATWAAADAARWAEAAAENGDAERAYQRALLAAYLVGEAELWMPP